MEGFFILLIFFIGFVFVFSFISSVLKVLTKESGIFAVLLSALFLGFLFSSDDDIDDC